MSFFIEAYRNIKTTLGGIGSIAAGVALIAGVVAEATQALAAGHAPNWNSDGAQLAMGAGLISAGYTGLAAKDGNKTGTVANPDAGK
ncbi:MAG: hypothetical protein WDN46_08255 [Methylocella sp.]